MTPPPWSAVRLVQGLLTVAVATATAAMLLPGAAAVLTTIALTSIIAAACVRLPLAATGWRSRADRRFLLAAGALLVVVVVGAVLGQVLSR